MEELERHGKRDPGENICVVESRMGKRDQGEISV